MLEDETNIGCYICSGPILHSAGSTTLDVTAANGRLDIYLLCARCGEGIRKGVESSAKKGLGY